MTTAADNDIAPLRWGIMGAARIAGKSLIPALRRAGAPIVAVAASDRARAERFAQAHELPKAVEGYQALLDDPGIDAVYLPLANGLHKEWAIKAAEAGKHCLCEKPMALGETDGREIAAAFARAGVRLQEAFMWRHHAQAAWVKHFIGNGELGDLRRIDANFSFTLDRPDDYRWRMEQGGGALWDIGCYCVNASRYFFGAEPAALSARAIMGPWPDGVDHSTVGWLDFGDGRLATFSCSFVSAFCQGIELLGTQARLWIPKPWLQVDQPTKVVIESNNHKRVHEFEPMNAYVEMIRNFTRAARDPHAELLPGEDGAAQARAMDGLWQSVNAEGVMMAFAEE